MEEKKHMIGNRELRPWLAPHGFDGAMCSDPWFSPTFRFPSPNNTSTITSMIDIRLQRYYAHISQQYDTQEDCDLREE
jgi:hypothetical protein